MIHSRTTPYNPQETGLVERMNCTLLNMLRTLPVLLERPHKQTYSFIQLHRSRVNGLFSIFPAIWLQPTPANRCNLRPWKKTGAKSHAEHATKWKSARQEAYSLALKSAMKSAMRGKKSYDKRVRSSARKWEIVSLCTTLPLVVDLASSLLSGKTKSI